MIVTIFNNLPEILDFERTLQPKCSCCSLSRFKLIRASFTISTWKTPIFILFSLKVYVFF